MPEQSYFVSGAISRRRRCASFIGDHTWLWPRGDAALGAGYISVNSSIGSDCPYQRVVLAEAGLLMEVWRCKPLCWGGKDNRCVEIQLLALDQYNFGSC
jgi:hypothetical protein